MCKVGDIIVVNSYYHRGKAIKRHSFVVIDDQHGEIRGMDYDFVANVLSSFKSEEQRRRKLQYPGNFPIDNSDTITDPDNGKNAYIKADQLYYFNKEKISYEIIGHVLEEIMELIFEFIDESDFPIEAITDNI